MFLFYSLLRVFQYFWIVLLKHFKRNIDIFQYKSIWKLKSFHTLGIFTFDCSHEIERRLLLGRKVMTNLDSIFKSRDITLPTKVRLVIVSHSVVPDSLWPHGLQPTRLLSPWDFSRQGYWSGLPFPSTGNLPNQARDQSRVSCTAARFFTEWARREARLWFFQ